MIEINIHNYEEYVIDYLEGQLSSGQEDAFVNFLIDHPSIAQEIEGLAEVSLPKMEQEFSFPGKENLLKEPQEGLDTSHHFDALCVAKIEGDLSTREEREFAILLNEDPQKAKAFSYYKKTKLRPDRTVRFQGKSKLKKQVFHRNRTLVWLSAAASVALLVSLFFMTGEEFSTSDSLDVEKIASVQKEQKDQDDQPPQLKEEEVIRENRGTKLDDTESLNKNESTNSSEKGGKGNVTEVKLEKTTNEDLPVRESRQESIEKLELLAESSPGALRIENEDDRPALKTDMSTTIYHPGENDDPINAFTKTAVQGINKMVFDKEKEHPASEKISFWDVAGLGVKGINRLTGSDMELKKSYDEEGNVKSLAFNSKAISFTHKTDK